MPLYKARAPALPLPPVDYEQAQQDQFQNALRLYFNRLDSFLSELSGNQGGGLLGFPYIAASDSTSQYATGNNTPTKVVWDSADELNGWTLDPSGYASPNYSGVYNIAYSLQLANTANAIHNANVWLKVNGADVPKSASKFTLQARKSALVYNFVVAYSSIVFEAAIGDEIELWWATDQAATSGGGAGIYMQAEAAQTTPFAHPSVPSAIGSITFVSAIPT
jgi:hypothetical protein